MDDGCSCALWVAVIVLGIVLAVLAGTGVI